MRVCQLVPVKQTSVTKKKDSLRAMALDSDNNQIQVKDVVKVVDGPHSVSSFLSDLLLFLLADFTVTVCWACGQEPDLVESHCTYIVISFYSLRQIIRHQLKCIVVRRYK